jgi:hypothetical protein
MLHLPTRVEHVRRGQLLRGHREREHLLQLQYFHHLLRRPERYQVVPYQSMLQLSQYVHIVLQMMKVEVVVD